MITIFIAFGLMASAISANKVILYALSPTLLVAIRMLIAGIILFLYTCLRPHYRFTWNTLKANILLLFTITICTTYLPSLMKAYALQNMASSKAAFFGTLDPFITAIYAYFLCNERLTIKKIIGIALGFLGACILLSSTSSFEEQLKAFSFISYPEVAALLAVMVGRYGWILAQNMLKKNIYTPAQLNTVTMLLSGILSLITALTQETITIGSLVNAPLPILYKFPFSHCTSQGQLAFFLMYTIFIGNIISYNLYAMILKRHTATFISLTGFSIPLFVHLYGWLFLNEQLSFNFFLSCTITFIGLWIFFQEEKVVTPV